MLEETTQGIPGAEMVSHVFDAILTFCYFWLSFVMQNHAIIVAAGKGQRFGGLKQFYTFQGRPLLWHALEVFEAHPNVHAITVVVPRNKIGYLRKEIEHRRLKKVCALVSGGLRRQDSVLNGLNTIKARSGVAIIHDGVRPVVSDKLVNRGIRLCTKHKAVIFGLPVLDTVKEVKNHVVIRTIPRIRLFLIQTPQFFDIDLIKNAYRKADLTVEYTDDAALLEDLGIPVYVYQGDRFNIKITQRSDLRLLSKIV